MFTGIIETIGEVAEVRYEKENLYIKIRSTITPELKIDQSIAHNGVCLTVINVENDTYTVTAIKETLNKTTLKNMAVGDFVNLERAMKLGDRLDGHIVQGHIDQKGVCTSIKNQDGSWIFTFTYNPDYENITIEKGSITVNGVSLTVINSKKNEFSVAIIPYTYNNTNFKDLIIGAEVNVEFDVIGKYIKKLSKPLF